MYKIKRDTENTALIEKKFVLKSVSEGYSRKYIRKNLNCIIRSAGRSENLVALVMAGELLAMLDDLNEFESTGEEYLQTSVYKGYKQDKIEMRGDRAEMSDFPLYLNTVAGALIVEIKPSAAFLLSSKSMLSQLSR